HAGDGRGGEAPCGERRPDRDDQSRRHGPRHGNVRARGREAAPPLRRQPDAAEGAHPAHARAHQDTRPGRAAEDLRDVLIAALERLRLYYARHEGRIAALFFAAGFMFDTVAVGRVDSWHMIAQQVVYLAIVTTLLAQ